MDILIVDDEPLARERLMKMAEKLGHEVVGQASNSSEATTLIQHLDPSAVLLDIEMPGDNGHIS